MRRRGCRWDCVARRDRRDGTGLRCAGVDTLSCLCGATSGEGSSSKDQDLDKRPTPKMVHGRGLAPTTMIRQSGRHCRVRGVPPRARAAGRNGRDPPRWDDVEWCGEGSHRWLLPDWPPGIVEPRRYERVAPTWGTFYWTTPGTAKLG